MAPGRPPTRTANFFTKADGAEVWRAYDPSGYREDGNRGAQHEVRAHRLLAVAMHGFDAVAGNDVHHRNGVPWDNRPANLQVLGHAEHGRLHRREQL